MDINTGLTALAAAFAVGCGCLSSLGESWIACHALDGMVRNPEMAGTLRTNMILAIALDESTAIYTLIIAILLIFVF